MSGRAAYHSEGIVLPCCRKVTNPHGNRPANRCFRTGTHMIRCPPPRPLHNIKDMDRRELLRQEAQAVIRTSSAKAHFRGDLVRPIIDRAIQPDRPCPGATPIQYNGLSESNSGGTHFVKTARASSLPGNSYRDSQKMSLLITRKD